MLLRLLAPFFFLGFVSGSSASPLFVLDCEGHFLGIPTQWRLYQGFLPKVKAKSAKWRESDAEKLARAQALPEFQATPLTKFQSSTILAAHLKVPTGVGTVKTGELTVQDIRKKLELLKAIDPDTKKPAFSRGQRRALFKAEILGTAEDFQAFLASLRTEDNEAGRLALADWLREYGERPNLAELLMNEYTLAQLPEGDAERARLVARNVVLHRDFAEEISFGLSALDGVELTYNRGFIVEVRLGRRFFEAMSRDTNQIQLFISLISDAPFIEIPRFSHTGDVQDLVVAGMLLYQSLWLPVVLGQRVPTEILRRMKTEEPDLYRYTHTSPTIRTLISGLAGNPQIRQMILATVHPDLADDLRAILENR